MYQLILLKCSNRIILYLKLTVTVLKTLQTRQYLNIFNKKINMFLQFLKHLKDYLKIIKLPF